MRYIVDGAYGFDNLGDEAMLATAIEVLQRQSSDIDLWVSSYSPAKITDLHDVNATNFLLLGTLLRNFAKFDLSAILEQISFIRNTDALIFAGGSILHDKKGLRNILVIFYKCLFFKIFGKKIVFWGVAHDRMNSLISKASLYLIMRCSSLVLLRDEKSFDLLPNNLKAKNHISWGVDILFGQISRLANVRPARPAVDDGELRIGLSLRPYPPNLGADQQAYDGALVKQLGAYLSKVAHFSERRVTVVPLIFSEGDHARDDSAIISRVQKCASNCVFLWPDLAISECAIGDFSNLLIDYSATISELDFVIGERFHSLVLAQILEVPYIAISYDKKIDQLVQVTGMKNYCVDLVSSLRVGDLSEQLLQMTSSLLLAHKQVQEKLSVSNLALERKALDNQRAVITALI